MDNEQIKKTIEFFKDDKVRVRDIAYILLSKIFKDEKTAYQCLFGTEGFEDYISNDLVGNLEKYMMQEGYIVNLSTDKETGDTTLSFEENKNSLIAMIKKIEEDMDSGVIEKKDGYARIVDIRTKLNDKFKVEAEKKDRLIVVEKKYNHICERFHCECYLPTKEDLMEMYNLVEK